MRQTNLFSATNTNMGMHQSKMTVQKNEKLESLKDKIDVQTSLQPKLQQDRNEAFKAKLRSDKLMNVVSNNQITKSELSKTLSSFKTSQLQLEKHWVGHLTEA